MRIFVKPFLSYGIVNVVKLTATWNILFSKIVGLLWLRLKKTSDTRHSLEFACKLTKFVLVTLISFNSKLSIGKNYNKRKNISKSCCS